MFTGGSSCLARPLGTHQLGLTHDLGGKGQHKYAGELLSAHKAGPWGLGLEVPRFVPCHQ